MNKLILLLFLLFNGCSNYKIVRVEARTPGDRVYYNESICYSPCDVKIKIKDSTYCDSTMTIKVIDKNYMINYIQLLGCKDTSIKVK
jgi:hypothetical protein